MENLPLLLFCSSPFNDKEADPDFEEEFITANNLGFKTLLFDYEHLIIPNHSHLITKRINADDSLKLLIYRGWMLSQQQYELLYNQLLNKNYKLINSPQEYRNCHYLPDSLKYIQSKTALTVYQKIDNEESITDLIKQAAVFGNKPVIIKDYVKSEKHHWLDACYVPDAGNKEKLSASIKNLIKLRDKYLNEGIVIREYMELKELTTHSKSGMPLTEEFRLFFYNKKLLGVYNYWEEGEYTGKTPDTGEFELQAQNVESNFFTMDIARKKTGELVIIELGDAQVAGLPEELNKEEFYRTLHQLSLNSK